MVCNQLFVTLVEVTFLNFQFVHILLNHHLHDNVRNHINQKSIYLTVLNHIYIKEKIRLDLVI